jgi:hypothetical protein
VVYRIWELNSNLEFELDTPLINSVREDSVKWRLENNDVYSVKTRVEGNWNLIWRCKIPP